MLPRHKSPELTCDLPSFRSASSPFSTSLSRRDSQAQSCRQLLPSGSPRWLTLTAGLLGGLFNFIIRTFTSMTRPVTTTRLCASAHARLLRQIDDIVLPLAFGWFLLALERH